MFRVCYQGLRTSWCFLCNITLSEHVLCIIKPFKCFTCSNQSLCGTCLSNVVSVFPVFFSSNQTPGWTYNPYVIKRCHYVTCVFFSYQKLNRACSVYVVKRCRCVPYVLTSNRTPNGTCSVCVTHYCERVPCLLSSYRMLNGACVCCESVLYMLSFYKTLNPYMFSSVEMVFLVCY